MLFSAIVVLLFTGTLCENDLFEGDIVLDQATKDIVDGKPASAFEAMTNRKWPNGVIPYVFDSNFDNERRKVVQQAIEDYSKYTCIKIVPRSNQKNYLHFINGRGCYSSIGMGGRGSQDISIGVGCKTKGIVMHELMHAAGFFHEQSRTDRDKYVLIHFDNILKGYEGNFKKYERGTTTLNEPYDYNSIMHYGKYYLSKNGRPTIVRLYRPYRPLGQLNGFSEIDKRQLNKQYACNGTTTTPTIKVTTAKDCTDKKKECKSWATVGYCRHKGYIDYMNKTCCESCRQKEKLG